MSLDADIIVDRRRMRRKLTFWRVFAILLAIGAVIAVGVGLRGQGDLDRNYYYLTTEGQPQQRKQRDHQSTSCNVRYIVHSRT